MEYTISKARAEALDKLVAAVNAARADDPDYVPSLAQAVRTGGAHELTHEQAKMIRDRAAVLAQLQGGGAMLATRLAEFIDRSGPYAEMETTAKPKGK